MTIATATDAAAGNLVRGASKSPVVRCADVHKAYWIGDQRVDALRGVDLTIDEPGYYAIMGASGSGKSTLLHLLAALDKPDKGEVYVGGRPLHELSDRELTLFRRKSIGVVFQQFNLIPTLTARENVELPGVLAGDDPKKLYDRGCELLDALGMSHRGDHRPDALSGGEQQRVAVARALLYSPSVLFADEPTGNLDSAASERMWQLLAGLAAKHEMTVLMVTHEPAAAAHCRRVYVLRDGRVTGTIDTEGMDASGVAARYQELVRAE